MNGNDTAEAEVMKSCVQVLYKYTTGHAGLPRLRFCSKRLALRVRLPQKAIKSQEGDRVARRQSSRSKPAVAWSPGDRYRYRYSTYKSAQSEYEYKPVPLRVLVLVLLPRAILPTSFTYSER
jgi:hypothetical protein